MCVCQAWRGTAVGAEQLATTLVERARSPAGARADPTSGLGTAEGVGIPCLSHRLAADGS